GSESVVERLEHVDSDPSAADAAAADGRAVAAMLDEVGAAALSLGAIVRRVGVQPADVAARVDALVAAQRAVRAGDAIVGAGVFARLKEAVLAAVADHHRAQPMSDGIPREALREQGFARGNASVFDVALEQLAGSNRIAGR